MTTTALTVESPYGTSGKPGTGRNIFVVGNHYEGRWQITLPSQWTGAGVAFDPATYGFPGVVTEVRIRARDVLSQQQRVRYSVAYDYTNKKLCVWDSTDSDTADGDDLSSLVINVTAIGE
jgi:hypothetical protein